VVMSSISITTVLGLQLFGLGILRLLTVEVKRPMSYLVFKFVCYRLSEYLNLQLVICSGRGDAMSAGRASLSFFHLVHPSFTLPESNTQLGSFNSGQSYPYAINHITYQSTSVNQTILLYQKNV